VKKEDVMMCIIYPDRPTGITKMINAIPAEYRERILVFPINSYEELISSTAVAEEKLKEHFEKTRKNGWLVIELLEDSWKSVQDYYCRLAYGETLGEYFAKKRADVKAMKEDSSAFRALEGWGDWPVIKYFHNYNWIDKIKRMPFNVVFTSEIKEEGNKDSIFFDLGYRPAGEKDNIHRVDTVLYLSHKENRYFVKPYKLTGFRKLYGQIEITLNEKNNKGAYELHKEALDKMTKLGYRISPMDELEEQAGIVKPKEEVKPHTPDELDEVLKKAGAPDMIKDIKENLETLAKTETKKEVKKEKPKEVKKEEDEWTI